MANLEDPASVLRDGFRQAACWEVSKKKHKEPDQHMQISCSQSPRYYPVVRFSQRCVLLLTFPETLSLTAGAVGIHLRNLEKDRKGNDSLG